MPVKKQKKKMSESTKIALFGAIATIVAAIITGIFTLVNRSPLPNLSQVTNTPIEDNPPGVYVWLDWVDENNYNYDIDLQVESDLPETKILFWAHQFGFNNGPGGYIGLQTVEGETKAIFSIWDALSGSEGCDTFSGEGTGIRCFIDYDWKTGETYRLRIWADPDNHAWIGAVYNYATNEEVRIGTIFVPEDRGMLSPSSVVWTEYVGFDTCKASFSNAIWSKPIVRNGSGEGNPQKATVAYGGGNCELSNVSYLGDFSFRLESGLGTKRTTEEGAILFP
jgi:hypothetical protein